MCFSSGNYSFSSSSSGSQSRFPRKTFPIILQAFQFNCKNLIERNPPFKAFLCFFKTERIIRFKTHDFFITKIFVKVVQILFCVSVDNQAAGCNWQLHKSSKSFYLRIFYLHQLTMSLVKKQRFRFMRTMLKSVWQLLFNRITVYAGVF